MQRQLNINLMHETDFSTLTAMTEKLVCNKFYLNILLQNVSPMLTAQEIEGAWVYTCIQ